MGGFGNILQGLTTAVGGIAEGVGERQKTQRELARQARLDALEASLKQAQIDNYRALAGKNLRPPTVRTPAAKTPPHLVDPGTGMVYERDPATGEWEPAKMGTASPAPAAAGPTPGAPTPPPPPPAAQPLVMHQRPTRTPKPAAPKPTRTVQSVTADGRTVITQLGPTGHPISSDTLASGRAPTMIQQQAASQLPAAEDAVSTVSRIATTHPDSYEAAVRFLRAHRHAKLGGDLIAEGRGMLADADAQRVVQAYNAYLLATIPNARPNVTTIDMESEASLPAAFGDRSTWPDALRMMSERVQALRIRGGRVSPPAANAPPKRFFP